MSTGARVILACKNKEDGEKVAEEIRKKTDNSNIIAQHLDLSSKECIYQFAETIKKSELCCSNCIQDFLYGMICFTAEEKLHLLIHNAAICCIPHTKTEDGFEKTMMVNYLGKASFPLCPWALLPGNSFIMIMSHGRSFPADLPAHRSAVHLDSQPHHQRLFARARLCPQNELHWPHDGTPLRPIQGLLPQQTGSDHACSLLVTQAGRHRNSRLQRPPGDGVHGPPPAHACILLPFSWGYGSVCLQIPLQELHRGLPNHTALCFEWRLAEWERVLLQVSVSPFAPNILIWPLNQPPWSNSQQLCNFHPCGDCFEWRQVLLFVESQRGTARPRSLRLAGGLHQWRWWHWRLFREHWNGRLERIWLWAHHEFGYWWFWVCWMRTSAVLAWRKFTWCAFVMTLGLRLFWMQPSLDSFFMWFSVVMGMSKVLTERSLSDANVEYSCGLPELFQY